MARRFKYLNVDVVAFLEEAMRGNTEHYQSDFEIDKAMIERFAASTHKEDKTLLWLSRTDGTVCLRECDAFLKGAFGFHAWQYFANEGDGDRFVSYAVELSGMQDGVVFGNVYELDYLKHAHMAAQKAQTADDIVKTFEDGFEAQVALTESWYDYWAGLVEQHGAIVGSRAIPSDKDALRAVLLEQKRERDKLQVGAWERVAVGDIDRLIGHAKEGSDSSLQKNGVSFEMDVQEGRTLL